MNLNAREIKLPERWQRFALFVFGIATPVSLLPMLAWPQSMMARGFCVATGSVGLIALACLVVAATRHVITASPVPDNAAS